MLHTVHFVFGLPAIWMVMLISQTDLVAGSCDSPWFENNGSCYYMSPNEDSGEVVLSWHDAEDWCRQNGAHLTTVDSKEELDAIVNTTADGAHSGAIWIGLNRLNNDQKTYEWVDGSVSGFRHWAAGQPKNGSVGMCVNQLTHRLGTCVSMVEDENILKTIIERPEDAQPPDTFHFWSTYNFDDVGELARCQQSCMDEPNCYYYTFVSWSSTDLTWDGTCTGASREHAYNTVFDQYAYSGIVDDCSTTGTWYEGNCGEKRGFVCERRIDDSTEPLPTPAPTPSVPGYCPGGFFEAGGNKCFKLVEGTPDDGLTWEEARQRCLAEKGHAPNLGSIHSEYENAAITMHLRTEYWGIWIGLQQLDASNPWLWADNQDPEYLNWAAGEPSGSEFCAELWTNPGPAGTWNNENCNDRRGYLCQTYKDADEVISTPASTVAHSCATDYYNYGGICYRKVTESSDWSSALVTCEADGGTLATAHSDAENSALYVFASDIAPFWIGYYKNDSEQWAWTDDWPNIYSNWNASEGPGTGGGCASFKDTGKWKDDTCTNPLNFVCMISTATVPTKPPEMVGVCLEGWVEFGAFCYYFSDLYDRMTWTGAEQQCADRASQFSRGSLVSIHSPAENAFVYKMLQSKGIVDAWIGLRELDPDSAFTWSDGSVVEYVRWAPGEPNDRENAEHCVEMYVNLWPGMWNDNACSYFYFEYVCKAPKVDQITTTTPTPSLAPCPHFDETQKAAAGQRAIPPAQDPGSDSSELTLSSGELAGIILGTMFGTLLLVAIGVLIWYVVRGGQLPLSKVKKTDDKDAASSYDLPYNNFGNSLSRSSSVISDA